MGRWSDIMKLTHDQSLRRNCSSLRRTLKTMDLAANFIVLSKGEKKYEFSCGNSDSKEGNTIFIILESNVCKSRQLQLW